MIRALISTLLLLSSTGLPACAQEPERRYAVRLVFFEFHDTKVKLTIDGNLVVDQSMASPFEHSTGLNLILPMTLGEESHFVLGWDKREVGITIHADSGTRIVYITPSSAPYISTSDLDVVQLD